MKNTKEIITYIIFSIIWIVSIYFLVFSGFILGYNKNQYKENFITPFDNHIILYNNFVYSDITPENYKLAEEFNKEMQTNNKDTMRDYTGTYYMMQNLNKIIRVFTFIFLIGLFLLELSYTYIFMYSNIKSDFFKKMWKNIKAIKE